MGFGQLRRKMVDQQLIPRGINDQRVLAAFTKVPRHSFVPEKYHDRAYGDYPLPIGQKQTISQPYMVALMTQSLELSPNSTVLEIGTGSGYQTAILALLCSKVYSVERISELTRKARTTLKQLGFNNVNLIVRDGTLGWPEFAPYNGIIVTAGAPEIPNSLIEQLADNGRMVIPVGSEVSQTLNLVEKHKGRIYRKEFFGCAFVPLVGKSGWK